MAVNRLRGRFSDFLSTNNGAAHSEKEKLTRKNANVEEVYATSDNTDPVSVNDGVWLTREDVGEEEEDTI